MSAILNHLPELKGVYQEAIELDKPFEEMVSGFADDEGTVILMSGSGLDCSQYHMLAAVPWMQVKSRQDQVTLSCGKRESTFSRDIFSLLKDLVKKYSLAAGEFDFPIHTGLFGYFAYDLKDRIEHLPVTCTDTFLPDLCLYAPSIILIQDKATLKTRLFIPKISSGDNDKDSEVFIRDTRALFFEKAGTSEERGSFSLDDHEFQSSFTKPEYIEAVKKIIAYLKAGDIYQANLSQRFEAGFSGDTYALFLDLFSRNPAAFFAYIQAGDHTVVSTSPERFVQQKGRFVETRPIKGTIARGATPEQDKENGRQLAQSLKDDAELTMIVDLMRNDISRVTTHGSVVVTEHKRIEPYENVFHLVSIVQGELDEDKNSVDLIRATFPGGSITGCPKIRSMEVIDELEPVKRHVYTGSIGYISFHDTMDLSIAIRTATVSEGRICFSVGGGIVYDSDPEKEYQETLDKGKTLLETLSGKKIGNQGPGWKAWINGKIVDQEQARVNALSPGFQYGAGLFETIRVEKGNALRLEDHLKRLNGSLQALFDAPPPDISWDKVIQYLIEANRAQDKVLAVKLLVSEDSPDSGRKFFLGAFAREYTHRLELLEKDGLDLAIFPNPRQTPLADHKTLNYLYYDQAGRYAKANRANEAVILNADGTVSETNTASLIAVDGRTVWVPLSMHVLPGVTLKSVLTILADKGYDIRKKEMSVDEFFSCPNIILTNALMGAVRALSIEKKKIEHNQDICKMINQKIFGF